MFCANCGKQLPDNAKFCTGCGTKLGAGVSSTEITQPQQIAASSEKAPGFLISINNQESGPYSFEQIQTMMQSGQVTVNHWVCREGASNWTKIDQSTEFSSYFNTQPFSHAAGTANTAAGKESIWAKILYSIIALAIIAVAYFVVIKPIFSLGKSGIEFVSDKLESATQSPPQSSGTSGTTGKKPNLELLSESTESDLYYTYIVGTVKNNSSKEYSYVQISFALFDSAGNQVGTALANVSYLASGDTWRFKAIIMAENAATYQLADLTGW